MGGGKEWLYSDPSPRRGNGNTPGYGDSRKKVWRPDLVKRDEETHRLF